MEGNPISSKHQQRGMEQIRACVHIEGIVQGVGFRPFVYNLARTHDLSSWALNNEQGSQAPRALELGAVPEDLLKKTSSCLFL